MAKGSSFSPLQLVSPAMLVFCFIMFFLPWIELACVPPPDATKDAPKEMIESIKKESGLDITKPIGYFSQSGLQIATGDVSISSDIEKLEKSKTGGAPKAPKDKPPKEELGGAPLLFLFPIALLAGIGFGVAPWPSPTRRFIAAGCCALAFVVLGLQVVIGFPLETKTLPKIKEQEKKMGGAMGGGMGFGGGDAKAKGKDAKELDIFKVRWKLPLYLTLLLLLGATGAALLPGGAPPKKKRRYDDDYDDEEEDDYEPPPRKKKRYDDEEDEDRPRKKKRYDDEDEDERPRKKKRYDDEDEDDRPRKKAKPPVVEDLPDDEPPPPPKSRPAARPAPPPAAPPALPPEPAGANPFAFDEEPPKKKPKRRDDYDDDEDDRPRKRR